MPRLGIDRDFLWEFGKLQRSVQDKVAAVFGEFDQATHTGLHLEKIAGVRDLRLRSIRIDKFWRGVVIAPDGDEVFTLLRVLPHDDAYAWARRQRASVNRATGAIELRDVVAVEEELPGLLGERPDAAPLLAGASDADLARLGIDTEVLPFARGLTDPVQLDQARGILPSGQSDVLYGLAAGLSPEEVSAEIAGAGTAPGDYDPDDLAGAIERSPERILLVTGPDELMDAFARPFDRWRVFLHPAQRRAAYGSYRGPARVTGGPGTGRTVAALHRALHLARRTPDDRSVLLTTFTRTLTAALEDDLRVLLDGEGLLRRVDVRGLDQLAHQVAHQVVTAEHGRPQLLPTAEERTWWAELAAEHDVDAPPGFLAEEWRGVVLAQGITDPLAYVRAPRPAPRAPGAGAPCPPPDAADLGGRARFTERLAAQRRWTHESVCVEATRLLDARPERPYRHVVVDEAQDLAAWQWRLLRAAVAPAPDDLFIAGDAHQRIYSHRVSLRRLGIDVTGRSERLSINYRTTAEILAWSVGLLHGDQVEGLDADVETLSGCRSEIHGDAPVVAGFPRRDDELAALLTTVRGWMDDGVEPGRIGVAARTSALARSAADALVRGGVDAAVLGPGAARDGVVAVATMQGMKGLEFRCMALVGVEEGQVPHPSSVTAGAEDAATHRLDVERERCLLFVACTRARERLAVSWRVAPSPFLPSDHHN